VPTLQKRARVYRTWSWWRARGDNVASPLVYLRRLPDGGSSGGCTGALPRRATPCAGRRAQGHALGRQVGVLHRLLANPPYPAHVPRRLRGFGSLRRGRRCRVRRWRSCVRAHRSGPDARAVRITMHCEPAGSIRTRTHHRRGTRRAVRRGPQAAERPRSQPSPSEAPLPSRSGHPTLSVSLLARWVAGRNYRIRTITETTAGFGETGLSSISVSRSLTM
jgi:hypothetical protein